MRVIFPMVVIFGFVAIGYVLGALARPKDPMLVALKEHARLIAKAARASRRGRHGLANVYSEAATRVLEASEHKQLGP